MAGYTEQRLIPFPSFLFPYFFEQWSSLHLFFISRNAFSLITITNGDNFTLKAVGQLTTSIEPSEVDIAWYFNDHSVGSSSRVRNQNFISRDLIRTSSTYNYAGIYEALLIWNMNQECSSYYRQLSSNPVILARASIEVSYHGE